MAYSLPLLVGAGQLLNLSLSDGPRGASFIQLVFDPTTHKTEAKHHVIAIIDPSLNHGVSAYSPPPRIWPGRRHCETLLKRLNGDASCNPSHGQLVAWIASIGVVERSGFRSSLSMTGGISVDSPPGSLGFSLLWHGRDVRGGE